MTETTTEAGVVTKLSPRSVADTAAKLTGMIDAKGMRRGFRYINHSCDPNTFFRCTPDRAEVYARRAIAKGEELTCDYGESQHNGTLPCRCGARACRGYI